ncbi:MAG: hypothetical protein J4F49_13615 [Rhodobacteraceae bacterium]|nr:hypothetical protein [Paracoccaceae bacterium]
MEVLDDRITILSRQSNATRVCVGINVKKHVSEISGHNPGIGGFIDLNAFQNQWFVTITSGHAAKTVGPIRCIAVS